MDELNTNATIVSETNQWLPYGITLHDKCTHQSLVLRSINDPYTHGLQRDMSMHRVIKYLVGLHASVVHQLTSVGRQNITKSDLLHTAFFFFTGVCADPAPFFFVQFVLFLPLNISIRLRFPLVGDSFSL